MPALYALAQHDGLVEADGQLLPSEILLAFLDDLYVVTTRGRAHEVFETVTECVERKAGVRTHLGKLKAWSSGGGPAPREIRAIGPDVWTSDKPDHLNGLVVLGTPLGKKAFVEAFVDGKIEVEKQFLEKVLKIEDIQCAWVMLSMSAVPRANHLIRMLPPSISQDYAERHDELLWSNFCKLCGAEVLEGDLLARDIARLPGRIGGMGLHSAVRSARGVYWASWVNALPIIYKKYPRINKAIVKGFDTENLEPIGPNELVLEACGQEGSVHEAELIRIEGIAKCAAVPTWREVLDGAIVPMQEEGVDPSEFDRGWQCFYCSFVENLSRTQIIALM